MLDLIIWKRKRNEYSRSTTPIFIFNVFINVNYHIFSPLVLSVVKVIPFVISFFWNVSGVWWFDRFREGTWLQHDTNPQRLHSITENVCNSLQSQISIWYVQPDLCRQSTDETNCCSDKRYFGGVRNRPEWFHTPKRRFESNEKASICPAKVIALLCVTTTIHI